MTDEQEQPQPEQRICKKSVMLRFADLEVSLETEDNHDLAELNILAMQDLSIMVKDRVAYPALFEEEPDEDTETAGGPNSLMPTGPQKPEIRVMYQ